MGVKERITVTVKVLKKNSIEVYFQNYNHPQYDQKTLKFIKNMSIIDLLFNEGPNSYKILMQNNEKLHK